MSNDEYNDLNPEEVFNLIFGGRWLKELISNSDLEMEDKITANDIVNEFKYENLNKNSKDIKEYQTKYNTKKLEIIYKNCSYVYNSKSYSISESVFPTNICDFIFIVHNLSEIADPHTTVSFKVLELILTS